MDSKEKALADTSGQSWGYILKQSFYGGVFDNGPPWPYIRFLEKRDTFVPSMSFHEQRKIAVCYSYVVTSSTSA
jgi:hypothetical protein